MPFFVTEKETEDLLQLEERGLTLPDGQARSFRGFRLMWKAMDFLIVCGKWSRHEIIDLALKAHAAGGQLSERPNPLPQAGEQEGPVSALEIRMLEAPRIDPAAVRPISRAEGREALSLDECLHNVVAALYRDLQQRLG